MRMLNMYLVNIIRRSFFQLTAQSGAKRAVFLIRPNEVNTSRTFVLSTRLNKKSSPDATEKLDLDGWKDVIRAPMQEETSEKPSDTEDDPNVAATKELIEVMRLTSKPVPENFSEEEFKKLLERPSKTSKTKYILFLAKKENMKKAKKEKQARKKALRETLNAEGNSNDELKYRLVRKLWDRTEDTAHCWRVAQSMIFGQPLVFDMSFENEMSQREMENAVKQMMECEAFNRKAKDPFHLHYCSLVTNSPYYKEFVKRYGEVWDRLMVTVNEKAYSEIFPRDQLVYLTADSPYVMNKFEHDKIYIIGCLVDKKMQTGLSFARAKQLNLATARLPLDRYLDWQLGAKNLTLNQMLNILLALKDTGDWEKALKFVPQRKYSFEGSSLNESEMCKKAETYGRTVSQKKSDFAGSSLKRQMKHRWWEDVSS